MIIDMSDWMQTERQAPTIEGAEALPHDPPPPPKPADKVVLETTTGPFEKCQHKSMVIDDKQRTVKCGQCGIWLEPVWCLRELFRYYEERIDRRVEAIKSFEKRQKADEERKAKRKKPKPRSERVATAQELIHRAAYNEYQAKILAARAIGQQQKADKIVAELDAEEP